MFHLLVLFLIGRLDNLDKGEFLCLYVCLCMGFGTMYFK